MATGILRQPKYAAKALGAQISEPLIPADRKWPTESSFSSDEDESEDYSQSKSTLRPENILPTSMSNTDVAKTLVISLLVAGGLAASASAIIAAQTVIVVAMGGICIVNAPVVAHKHLHTLKNASLETHINTIKKDIGLLKVEVNFLQDTVDDLQDEANQLSTVQQGLNDIAKVQGTTTNKLVELVKENELILAQMKRNLTQTFVASMAKVVLRSADRDLKINKQDLPLLSLRLQFQLQPFGITLDTNKFEDMIRENNDIVDVLRFCGTLLFPKMLDDEKDDDSVDSEVTFDFEQFCSQLDKEEEEKMSHEEKVSMVTIDERYSGGSVEVARGKRMTLLQGTNKRDLHKKSLVKEMNRRQTKLAMKRATLHSRPLRAKGDSRISIASGLVVVKGRGSVMAAQ